MFFYIQVQIQFIIVYNTLKMLGLYLVSLILGKKMCTTLSILNELLLQKEFQHFLTNNLFLTNNKRENQTEKPCQSQ